MTPVQGFAPMRSKSVTNDLFAVGATLAAGAGVLAVVSRLHMQRLTHDYGAICGSASGAHCPSCYASLSLLAMSLASIIMARAAAPAARARPVIQDLSA